jgi:nucleotide-binding universal stress UspA family protein
METDVLSHEPHETRGGGSRAPILVATDGTAQSDGAIATACALATASGAEVQVVAVQPSLALIVPDAQLMVDPSVTAKLNVDLTDLVTTQCARTAKATATQLHPEVLSGDPPRVISRTAAERGAQLVVVGLGQHNVMDRIFGDETALKLARVSRVPVLAVPEDRRTAPRTAVAGVDFSEASVRAAQIALQLMPEGGALHLIHVMPRERTLLEPWLPEQEYERLVQHNFRRLRARLGDPHGVDVTDVTRAGDAARALLAYAEETNADVVVTGSHGLGFVSRVVLGSVTTKVLRAAPCAVLVVPPDTFPATDRDTTDKRLTLHADPARWVDLLDDFTRTNAGRRTTLEVDDPEIGAQGQEHDYPLLGVAYDPHDRRVEVMLGRTGTGEPHLSRSIGDVKSIDVLAERSGRDLALRVRHGNGQSILSLAP